MGVLGSLWIVFQYGRRRILRNSPSFIIAGLACLDIIQGILYIALGICSLLKDTLPLVANVLETLFDWFLISYAFTTIQMSLYTFCLVKVPNSSSYLEKFRGISLFACFIILPPFCFACLSWATDQELFPFISPCFFIDHGKQCAAYSYGLYGMIMVIVCFSTLSCLVAYYSVYTTLFKQDGYVRQTPTLLLIKRLVMVYSFCTIISCLPLILMFVCYIFWLYVLSSTDGSSTPLRDFVLVMLPICEFANSLRGYFHALSVLYVFQSLERREDDPSSSPASWCEGLNFLFLQTPLATKEELQYQLSKSLKPINGKEVGLSTYCPSWTIGEQESTNVTSTECCIRPPLPAVSKS